MHAPDQPISISAQQALQNSSNRYEPSIAAKQHKRAIRHAQHKHHTYTALTHQSKHQSTCSLLCCRALEAPPSWMDAQAAPPGGPHSMATRHRDKRRPVGGYNCWATQQQFRETAAALGWPVLREGQQVHKGLQTAAAAALHARTPAQLRLGAM